MWGLSSEDFIWEIVKCVFQAYRLLVGALALVLLVLAYRQRKYGRAAAATAAGLLLLMIVALSYTGRQCGPAEWKPFGSGRQTIPW